MLYIVYEGIVYMNKALPRHLVPCEISLPIFGTLVETFDKLSEKLHSIEKYSKDVALMYVTRTRQPLE